MKKLIVLLILLVCFIGCKSSLDCDRGSVPDPPWGTPSDTTWYQDGDYLSITYWYFYDGKGQYKRYVSENDCDEWHPDSEGWSK